jgi:putative PIN family toxin of toxin-antitoxin system
VAKARLVLDSNVWISGALWTGVPHRIIRLIERNEALAFATPSMLDEVREALGRPKFAARFRVLESSPSEIMEALTEMVTVVAEGRVLPVVLRDPEDDKVLACVVSSNADCLISGDRHVLDLERYGTVPICKPAQFWRDRARWTSR